VKAAKMIEEIAAGSSIYFVEGSPYSVLVPFIWDNALRTEEHESVVNGLRQLPQVADSIIVARPGLMEAFTPAATGA
jgi:REase_DpnII-MboI